MLKANIWQKANIKIKVKIMVQGLALFFKRLLQLIILMVILGVVTQSIFYFGEFSYDTESTIRQYGIVAAILIFWCLVVLDRYKHRRRLS